MALGKYSRVENGRRSSASYWSSVTIVLFVGLCLVGVWMMTSSSSVVPVQSNVEEKSGSVENTEAETKVKQDLSSETATENSGTRQFEDNQGDLAEDATKGDTATGVSLNKKDEDGGDAKDGDSEDSEKKSDLDEKDGKSESDDGDKSNGSDEKDSKSDEDGEKKSDSDDDSEKKSESDENDNNKSDSGSEGNEKKFDDSNGEVKDGEIEQRVEQTESDDTQSKNQTEVFPSGAQSELLNETTTQNGAWSTQAAESKNEKEAQSDKQPTGYNWKLCNVTAGYDYIPCLDNWQAIRSLRSTKHYEHRERHCPENPPTCLVPLPEGYKRPIQWPTSREKVKLN